MPAGAFVFLSDVDFVPTPDLHSDLTAGKWVSELEDMRDSYERREERRVLVVPAFERLEAAPDDRSGSLVVPYKAPCLKSEGCAVIQGFKVPRSFGMLRTMLQRAAVGVFHRKKACPPPPRAPPVPPHPPAPRLTCAKPCSSRLATAATRG